MIIDLPPQLETAISHQAKRHGMATSDYIAQLVKKDLTNNQNPHDIGTMTEFYYDIERMDEALKAPRVAVPHFDTPEQLMAWMENLTEADFTEQP